MSVAHLIKELIFKTARSSGAGGQHINKVASKVSLFFDIPNSKELTQEEKTILIKNLGSRLTKDGVLNLSSSESRSQHRNKELVIKRFVDVITTAMITPKKRKSTRPGKASIKKRLHDKQHQAAKKNLRKKPDTDS